MNLCSGWDERSYITATVYLHKFKALADFSHPLPPQILPPLQFPARLATDSPANIKKKIHYQFNGDLL